MKGDLESGQPTAGLWRRSAAGGRNVALLLTATVLCALWLIVDQGLPSQLQMFTSAPATLSIDHFADRDNTRPWPCDYAVQKSVRERGAMMLHSWSDEELIKRAARAEDILEGLNNSTEASRVLLKIQSVLRCKPNGSQNPKIAFMFLISTGLPLAPVWEKFFQGNEDLYNIYIHGKPDWLRRVGFDVGMGVFWGRVVPSASTQRLAPNIVEAERRLLANALLDDPNNEWFALLSESCIPIQNFHYIYGKMNETSNSRIDSGYFPHSGLAMTRWKARGDTAMLPEVPFSAFRFGSQWFIIRRRHAVAVIRDRKYWPKFRLPCRRLEACVPDEHYIQTLIDNVDEGSCHGSPTFISWNGTTGGHPHSFGVDETTPHLIEAMKTQQEGRYFFARKFKPEALNTLLNMTDLLFR
ncbi:hypothetical protein R1flu_013815 [Riccia fluitans]|uniref:Uncharacterized protein n=1 Tax=Riccia fluitans TaxID=41844 RepID=A0ABD1YFG2_9MARC